MVFNYFNFTSIFRDREQKKFQIFLYLHDNLVNFTIEHFVFEERNNRDFFFPTNVYRAHPAEVLKLRCSRGW